MIMSSFKIKVLKYSSLNHYFVFYVAIFIFVSTNYVFCCAAEFGIYWNTSASNLCEEMLWARGDLDKTANAKKRGIILFPGARNEQTLAPHATFKTSYSSNLRLIFNSVYTNTDLFAPRLASVEIGNEPDLHFSNVSVR
jgi:hypothetical protein